MLVSPTPLLDMDDAFAQTALLVAAVRLRVFIHIAEGMCSVQQFAEYRGPVASIIWDISMPVKTVQGRIRPLGEYQHWLQQCGFQQRCPFNINGPFPILSVTKGSKDA